MPWWSPEWRKEAEDWTFLRLPSAAQAAASEAEAEVDYLSVFLKSARVVDVRRGFTTFYGTVHSAISLAHRSGGQAEFNIITTPASLKNVDASGLDRVIQLNQRLLGPVAYAGGDLSIEVGLFSVASSNLAAPYLQLLENLSKAAGVSYASVALPFAGPILEGMKLLTNSEKEVALEVGLSMTQPVPKLGYFAIVKAPKHRLDASNLRLDPSDFRLLLDGAPLRDYPYMIIEVSAERKRADWFAIPEIAEAYRRVQDEYRAGREQGVAEALTVFRRVALTCNDLQEADARSLIDKVTAKFSDLGPPPTAVRGGVTRLVPMPSLQDIDLYGDARPGK